jgi:hypothetical protein
MLKVNISLHRSRRAVYHPRMGTLIPADKEQGALRMHAQGKPVADIHRFIWPQGTNLVSYNMLGTLLRTLAEVDAYVEPSDDLPGDLVEDMDALSRARERIREAMDADTEGTAVTAHAMAMAAVVKARIAASKHRIDLWEHDRSKKAEKRRAGGGRVPGGGSGAS